MNDNFTLGITHVGSGDLLTFLINDDSQPHRAQQVSIIALADIDVSQEMAEYYRQLDKTHKNVLTENALVGFVGFLADRGLVRVPTEVSVSFGTLKRPASRLANEYRYSLNPEEFWEEKLLKRYATASFTTINHDGHLLTVVGDVDAPFTLAATIINLDGEVLGVLRLDVLADGKHASINDDDLERLRLGLQADITMHVPEIMVMVDRISVHHNPTFGINSFRQHIPAISETPCNTEAVPTL